MCQKMGNVERSEKKREKERDKTKVKMGDGERWMQVQSLESEQWSGEKEEMEGEILLMNKGRQNRIVSNGGRETDDAVNTGGKDGGR